MNDTDKTKEDTGVHEEPRVMSKDDVHDYEGLTLNEDGKEEKKEDDEGYTIHIRRFSLKDIPLWKKSSSEQALPPAPPYSSSWP